MRGNIRAAPWGDAAGHSTTRNRPGGARDIQKSPASGPPATAIDSIFAVTSGSSCITGAWCGLGAGVDHQWSEAPPVFLPCEALHTPDIRGGVRPGKGDPQEVADPLSAAASGHEVWIIRDDDQPEPADRVVARQFAAQLLDLGPGARVRGRETVRLGRLA